MVNKPFYLCATFARSEILTVRRLSITTGNSSVCAHLEIHPSSLIICTREEETIITVDSGECRIALGNEAYLCRGGRPYCDCQRIIVGWSQGDKTIERGKVR